MSHKTLKPIGDIVKGGQLIPSFSFLQKLKLFTNLKGNDYIKSPLWFLTVCIFRRRTGISSLSGGRNQVAWQAILVSAVLLDDHNNRS